MFKKYHIMFAVKWHSEEWCIQYNYTLLSMGNLQGQEMNDTCRKTVHMGAMDKAFRAPYLNRHCIPVFKK